MAPEVITSQNYTHKADLWSIGVIIYQALTSRSPFPQSTPTALREFYQNHARIKAELPEHISLKLKQLLNQLLEKNTEKRITFEQFFNHPFLKDYKDLLTKQNKKTRPIDINMGYSTITGGRHEY